MQYLLSEKFIQIYNELDSFMRKELKVDDNVDHTFLIGEMGKKGNKIFEINGYELRQFARLRNAIVHNPYKKTVNTIAEPHEDIVQKYEELVNILKNPPKAISIAVPAQKIFTATLESNVQVVMETMLEKTYTHVPVVEDGLMVGIFSENTLLSYIASNKDCIITSDMKMSDFKKYIPVDKHQSEYFVFAPREILLQDVEDIFNSGLKDNKRISVIYITQNGKTDEKLLGMITAWDVAGRQKTINF